MNEQRQRICLLAAGQACLIVDWEGYDDMRLLSKNAVHVLRDHCPAREVALRRVDEFDQTRGEIIVHEYFVNFSKVNNSDQTASEPIGKMQLCLMTCVSP